jgi:hypothetical protein
LPHPEPRSLAIPILAPAALAASPTASTVARLAAPSASSPKLPGVVGHRAHAIGATRLLAWEPPPAVARQLQRASRATPSIDVGATDDFRDAVVAARAPAFAPTYASHPATAADSAAPPTDLVRSAVGRHGGGEVEIPPWFATAAKTVLAAPHAHADVSMAELVLIAATPPREVADSKTEATGDGLPLASTSAGNPGHPTDRPPHDLDLDVDAIARDVYHHLLVTLDARRVRTGHP